MTTTTDVEQGVSLWLDAWRRLRRNRLAVAGGVVLALVAVLAVTGPWCVPYAYDAQDTALGAVRSRLGRDLGLAAEKEFNFTWIIDFPLFEYNEDEKRWEASHHLFSMPQEKYIPTLESDPGSVKGDLYDLVCNGVELASGSIRVHDPVLQERIFAVVGFSMEEAKKRFGFLLEAFRYGPPPHGGIAPGLDRLVTLIAGVQTIRDVIAFPKNTVGASPMDDAPSPVDPAQLADLHLAVIEEEKEEA